MQAVPSNWKQYKLKDLSKYITAGATPSTKVVEYWNEGNIPWMSSGEVNYRFIEKTEKFITEKGYKNSSTSLIPKKSVLMALAGQGKTRGKVAVNNIELTTNQSLAAIIPNEKLNYLFLFYNLENRYDDLRKLSSGEGGRGGLNLKIISSLMIDLPPYEKQKKIANILSTWDQAIKLKQDTINLEHSIYKTKLNTFFKRLNSSNSDIFKQKEFMTEIKEKSFEPSLEKMISVKLHLKGVHKRELVGNEKNGLTNQYIRSADDFIYGKQNFHNGALGVVPTHLDGFTSSSDIPSFKVNKKVVLPKYVYYFWSRQEKYEDIAKLTTGTGSKRLAPSIFLNQELPITNLNNQAKFVKTMDLFNEKLVLLEKEIELMRLQKKGLMQQLLTGKIRVQS